MDVLISRQAAIDAVKEYFKFSPLEGKQCAKAIERVPSADRLIGHWIDIIDIDIQAYTRKVRCNKCGHQRSMMSTQGVYPNFCENCGADMRGE